MTFSAVSVCVCVCVCAYAVPPKSALTKTIKLNYCLISGEGS